MAEYEFSTAENQVISKTATLTKTWGVVSILIGLMQCCVGIVAPLTGNVGALVQLVAGIVAIVVGSVFIVAGAKLKEVTTTEGNDVSLMMNGLSKLGAAFLIQLITTIVGFILMVILVFMAATIAAFIAATA